MRRLLILTIAFMFICMPLLAQESGTEVSGSGADAGGEAGGCGKIMLGGMGGGEEEGAAVGTGVDEEGAEGDLYYDDGTLPAEGAETAAPAEEVQADCGTPDADGFFVCSEGGVSYTCYCCDEADQQIPYAEACEPCCMPME